jgi:hypothetical protein
MKAVSWAGQHVVKTTFRFKRTASPTADGDPRDDAALVESARQQVEASRENRNKFGNSWNA